MPLHVILNLSSCVQSYTLFVVIIIQIDYSKGKYDICFRQSLAYSQCYRVHIYISESQRIKIKKGGQPPFALMNVGKHEVKLPSHLHLN